MAIPSLRGLGFPQRFGRNHRRECRGVVAGTTGDARPAVVANL